MKRGLQDYTRTDKGRVYAIKGTQMHEDPLRLVPEELRGDFGVHIEGDLNPEARWLLDNVYDGDVSKVPVGASSTASRRDSDSGRSSPPTHAPRTCAGWSARWTSASSTRPTPRRRGAASGSTES